MKGTLFQSCFHTFYLIMKRCVKGLKLGLLKKKSGLRMYQCENCILHSQRRSFQPLRQDGKILRSEKHQSYIFSQKDTKVCVKTFCIFLNLNRRKSVWNKYDIDF